MKINWKVRLKNPMFWAQITAAIITPILVGMGVQWADMTSFNALSDVLQKAACNPVILVSIIVSVWTAITDPTTKGFSDSTRALTYTKPIMEEK